LLKFLVILLALGALGILALRWGGRGTVPEAGETAPDFVLDDAAHRRHALSDYRGRWLVLYFYPKDATPTCTAEACNLRDSYVEFQARGVALLGVSLDDSASHAGFTQRHHLPFPLLADPDATVARAYGSLWDFGFVRLAKRHTFLIDPASKVAKVYREITATRHAQEILADLTRFGVVASPSGANNQSVPPQ
jgi:peroxiredoxin Q/BCP